MNPFSILMLCFSGMLFLYAGLLWLTKDPGLIPRSEMAAIEDRRAYAGTFAKTMALVALAPLGSGFYGLFSTLLGLVMLFVNLALCIWASVRLFWRQS